MGVLGLTCPKTFYNVLDGFNMFILTIEGSSATITVPKKNYGRTSFATTLVGLLNAAAISLGYPGISFAITYATQQEADNGFYLFTVTGPATFTTPISFTFSSKTQSYLYQLMGFNYSTSYTFSPSTTTTQTLSSVNVINFQLEPVIVLHANCINNSTATSSSSVLQTIFANTSLTYTNIVFYQYDLEAHARPLIDNRATTFHFWFTDINNVDIDFNGNTPQFTVIFFKSNDTTTMQRGFIKMMSGWIITLQDKVNVLINLISKLIPQ
jgi:hypothetical protein